MKKLSCFIVAILIFFSADHAFGQDAGSLAQLLGKDIKGPEMQQFLAQINSTPKIRKMGYGDSYYSYKDEGVSLTVTKDNKVRNIFFFAEGADNNRQYQGELPYGISFSMTRSEVESMLGKPDTLSSDLDLSLCFAEYINKDLCVTYIGEDENNMDAPINNIQLRHTVN